MVRKQIVLVGGRLCLDFVNTVSWRGTEEPYDELSTYADLLRWSERAGALSRDQARATRRSASRHPRKATAVLAQARELRDAMYRILLAWKKGRSPRAADIALLNASAPARAELGWKRGRFTWAIQGTSRLDGMLSSIVWSASDLATEGQPRRLKSCGSDACGWLFYDESRSERRRWCSMSDCGNRAKAKRFYARATSTSAR